MGQGARTVFAQIAAEELGIDPDRIAIVMGDTAVVPFDSSTSASRSTVFMGNAVAEGLRRHQGAAQDRWRSARFDVSGRRRSRRHGASCICRTRTDAHDAELLQAHFGPPRGEVIGVGESATPSTRPSAGRQPAFWEMMCAAAEVEVDVETGMVRDPQARAGERHRQGAEPAAGRSAGRRRRRHGARAHADGAPDPRRARPHPEPRRARLPHSDDPGHSADELQSILIENGDGPGPFGAKGAGEGGILAIAAAIGSAVAEAAGVAIRDLPLTPERIWAAIQAGERAERAEIPRL